jgi:nucleobase:cation symporter-1, NCS1 family
VALTVVALTTDHLSWFYDYGWFTGSFLGAAIYYLMSRG